MQDSNIPAKFSIPFANGAGAGYIRTVPQASQISVQNGAASLTDGFPPDCFISIAAGGSWPFGQDFNGLLNQSTAWNRWQAAGGPVTYDATFSAGIGGYPKGAVLMNANMNGWWRNTVDNNTTNPDTGGANWVTFGGKYVGEVFAFAGATAPALCYPCDGRALSRSTYSLLFAAIGTTWGSGNGSTTFNIPDLRGNVLAGADAMGGTAAGRLTAAGWGPSAVLGTLGGSQYLMSHNHGVTDPGHYHSVPQSPHSHTGGDYGHLHPDPGHNHGDYGHAHADSGHTHPGGQAGGVFENGNLAIEGGYFGTTTGWGYASITTGYANIAASGTGIGWGYANIYTNGAYAGISNTANNYTGIAATNLCGGGASQNVQPTAIVNYFIFANA